MESFFTPSSSAFVPPNPNPPGPLGLPQLYVRTPAAGGSDTTGDGSPALPYATPQHALDVLGRAPGVIHQGSGTYTRPLIADKPGPLVFVGDGGGDPLDTALTVVIAPQAAGALTAAGLVVGAGFGAVNEGDSIEFLTGAATGQRRTIVSVETGNTHAIPAANFNPAPAPTDSFRVIRSTVLWDSQTVDELWIQRSGSAAWGPGIGSASGIPTAGPLAAIYFVNVGIAPGAARTVRTKDALVVAYGLELSANVTSLDITGGSFNMGCDSNQGNAGQIAALLGLPSATQYAGYTLTRHNAGTNAVRVSTGGLFGYIQGKAAGVNCFRSAVIVYLGGESAGIIQTLTALATLSIVQAPRLRLTGGAGLPAIISDQAFQDIRSGVQLVSGAGADAIIASRGSAVLAEGGAVVTGALTACNCEQGGRLYLDGAPSPTWTGGVADFRVSAAETQPAAFFAAVDATLVAAVGNGSLVTRAS